MERNDKRRKGEKKKAKRVFDKKLLLHILLIAAIFAASVTVFTFAGISAYNSILNL